MTDYLRPESLAQALQLRADNPTYLLLAGGTDLMVAANQKERPEGVIDIFGLDSLVGIHREDDGSLVIGAATTYREILAHADVATDMPALAAAAREVGALQIQARGTIGGNIGTSSPVGDTLPVLLALGAELELVSTRGQRSIAYDDYCTGYRETQLAGDELIASVRFPKLPEGTVQYWRKVGTRKAQSISKVMLAASALVEDGSITELRFGIGAVADRPIRAVAAEAAGIGKALGAQTAEAVCAAIIGEIKPIDDVRSTAAYRAEVAGNLARRFILSLA